MRHTSMHFLWRVSLLTVVDAGPRTDMVVSATNTCWWWAFSVEMIGAGLESMRRMHWWRTSLAEPRRPVRMLRASS